MKTNKNFIKSFCKKEGFYDMAYSFGCNNAIRSELEGVMLTSSCVKEKLYKLVSNASDLLEDRGFISSETEITEAEKHLKDILSNAYCKGIEDGYLDA